MKKGLALLLIATMLSSCDFFSRGESGPFGDGNNTNISDNPSGDVGDNNEDNPDIIIDEDDSKIKVSSITLEKEYITLGIGKMSKLSYEVLPIDADNKTLSWTSEDDYICRVTSSGSLQARHAGVTTITASSTDGSNISASCIVTVSEIDVTSISTSTKTIDFGVNEETHFTYSVYPSDATNKSVDFSVDDDSIINVTRDTNGFNVKALEPGEANITIKSISNPSVFASISVTVKYIDLKDINLSNDKIYINKNSTYELVTSFVPTNATNKNVTYSSLDESVALIDSNGVITAKKIGETTIVVTSDENSLITKTAKVVVYEEGATIKTPLRFVQKDLNNNSYYGTDAMPSKGTVKMLVIPVWFTDSVSYISVSRKEAVRKDIEKAFGGTNEETGWRSVKTYYDELSNNELDLVPVVSDWYECGTTSSNYASSSAGLSMTTSLVDIAVSWYRSRNNLASMESFDADHNGFIDSVVLVYACPDYYTWNKTSGAYENLWAYCYWTQHYPNVSKPTTNAFMWASFDFMYGSNAETKTGGKLSYGGSSSEYCDIDAHTYIHESGHLLGLNDYYDYSSQYTAAGGFSMQDQNVGSHDPYSVLKLGWSDPYIVSESKTITINSFQESKDVIMVTPNNTSSPFDEYILVELYTPTGLNEFDTVHQYGYYPQGVNDVGIRLWHVDGRLAYTPSGYYPSFGEDKVTTDPYTSGGKVTELMCNSFGGERELISSLADYSELFLIRNNKNVTFKPTMYDSMFKSEDLFKAGDVFNINNYSKQFKNAKKGEIESLFNNGNEFRFNIKVQSLSSNQATIQITKY